jgi:hypothetical protein
MTAPSSHPRTTAARVAVAASAALAAPVAPPAMDFMLSSGLFTVESVGPSTLLAAADGAWVLYAPTLSVDCSPPRGCYAKTQRIHYDFRCSPRYAVLTERISMDINGAIVKHEVADASSAYAPSYDAGASSVLDAFCPLPPRD